MTLSLIRIWLEGTPVAHLFTGIQPLFVASIAIFSLFIHTSRKQSKHTQKSQIVATFNGKTVGYIYFGISLLPDRPGTNIGFLRVWRNHRNKGLGSELMRRCLLQTKKPVYLIASKELIPFYEKFGFTGYRSKHNLPSIEPTFNMILRQMKIRN